MPPNDIIEHKEHAMRHQLRAWFQDHDDLGKGTFLRCPWCKGGVAARWRSGSLQVTCKTTCGDCERSEDTRVWPNWRGLDEYPQKQMDEVIEDEYYRDYKRSIGEEEE